jgi:hypothetical protein
MLHGLSAKLLVEIGDNARPFHLCLKCLLLNIPHLAINTGNLGGCETLSCHLVFIFFSRLALRLRGLCTFGGREFLAALSSGHKFKNDVATRIYIWSSYMDVSKRKKEPAVAQRETRNQSAVHGHGDLGHAGDMGGWAGMDNTASKDLHKVVDPVSTQSHN